VTNQYPSFGRIVSTDWLRQQLADPNLIIVDVRQAAAWQQAHLPGAVPFDVTSVHLSRSDAGTIAAWERHLQASLRALGVTREHRVVFYEDISGTSAAYGVWLLDAAGLGNGAMLDGGIQMWAHTGGALTTDVTPPNPSEIEIVLDPAVIATADEIRNAIETGASSLQVLDTRSTRENALGTIPGAIHVDWVQTLDPHGRLRPVDEIRSLYDAAGLDAESPAATFCASGFRAAHSYVLLKLLGYASPKNYVPSWSEWRQRGDLPIE
jgi:thiosulfate/3-mercaptopyruvate sulfurtransferase